MSGGCYQYAYGSIGVLADQIEEYTTQHPASETMQGQRVWDRSTREYLSTEDSAALLPVVDSERLWFCALLRVVSEAARAIEWVDSGDRSPGGELAEIRAIRTWIASHPGGTDANG